MYRPMICDVYLPFVIDRKHFVFIVNHQNNQVPIRFIPKKYYTFTV